MAPTPLPPVAIGPFRLALDVCPPGREVRRPCDAFAEILIVAQGSAVQVLPEGRQLCRPLSVSYRPLAGPKLDQVGEQGMIALRIDIAPVFAVQVTRDYFSCRGDAAHYPCGTLGDAPSRLLDEYSRADRSPLMIDGLIRQLIARAARTAGADPPERPPGWLAEGIELMRHRYRGALRIERLAGSLGVAPAHFSRVFRRWHGISPKQFLASLRLEEAALALARSSTAISEIALSLGFADQAHLTREFKKWAGVPPNEFRRGARQRAPSAAAGRDDPAGGPAVAAGDRSRATRPAPR